MANTVTTELVGRNEKLNSSLLDGKRMVADFAQAVPALVAPIGAAIAGAFAVSAIKGFVQESISSAQEAEDAWAKWEATVRAAGGAAKIAKEDLEALGAEMIRNTKFTDEAVVESASLLSIYENLQGEGIERTIRLAANMATLFEGSLTSSVRQVGRALDSPANGMRILRMAGVQLDEQTKELIQSLTQQGKISEAQEILFGKLEQRFNGLAEAMGETTSGRAERLTNRWGEMKETLGTALLPTLESVQGSLEALTTGFEKGLGQDVSEQVRKLNSELSVTDKLLMSMGEHAPNLLRNFSEGGAEITEGSILWVMKSIRSVTGDVAGLGASIETIEGRHAERVANRASEMPLNRAISREELDRRVEEKRAQAVVDEMSKWADERLAVTREEEAEKSRLFAEEMARWADERMSVHEEQRQMLEEFGSGGPNREQQAGAFRAAMGGPDGGPTVQALESMGAAYARISRAAGSQSPEKRIEEAVIKAGREQVEKLEALRSPVQQQLERLDTTNQHLQTIADRDDLGGLA